MEENQNVENPNISNEETISNGELIDIVRKLNSDNEVILRALFDKIDRAEDRRYEIVKVRQEIDSSMNKAFKNAFMCGVGALAFMSFAQIAIQKLGMPNILESMNNTTNYFINGDFTRGSFDNSLGFIRSSLDNLQNYIQVVFGPLNEWLTLDNLKNFVSEIGPIGSMAGLASVFYAKNVLKNLKEWNAKNRELNIMRKTMPEDVANTKKAMAEFSLSLTLQAIRNQRGQIFNYIKNCFNRQSLKFDNQISEPKSVAGFNNPSDPILNSSMNDCNIEKENDSDELNNDSKLGRSR